MTEWGSGGGLADAQDAPDDAVRVVIEEAKDFAGRLDPAPLEGLADHSSRVARVISQIGDAYLRLQRELPTAWLGPAGEAAAGALGELVAHTERIQTLAKDLSESALNAVDVARYTKNCTAELHWLPPPSPYDRTTNRAANQESAQAALDCRNALDSGLRHLAGVLESAMGAAGGLRRLSSHPELLHLPYQGVGFTQLAGRGRGVPAAPPSAFHDPLADTLSLGSRATPGTSRARPGFHVAPTATSNHQAGNVIGEPRSTGNRREEPITRTSHELSTGWMQSPPNSDGEPKWHPPVIGDARDDDPGRSERPPIIPAYDYKRRPGGDPR